jgi:Zn-dependent M28 family amino/carboxypeptidase
MHTGAGVQTRCDLGKKTQAGASLTHTTTEEGCLAFQPVLVSSMEWSTSYPLQMISFLAPGSSAIQAFPLRSVWLLNNFDKSFYHQVKLPRISYLSLLQPLPMSASIDRLYRDVEFLTSLTPARNYLNLHSLESACTYIKTAFEKMGALPEEQGWLAEGKEYKNIIASYNPEKSSRLIVGAHYDVCGNQPGADDNGSAVAGLLETARLLFEQQPQIDYRIDFVAYCLEEPPFFATKSMGSYVHAKSLHDSKADVMGMICYEMIGYFSDAPNSQSFPSPLLATRYPSTGNFIIVVGIEKYKTFNETFYQLMQKEAAIDVQVISFPPGFGSEYAGLSDQRNYWTFDYPALMINDTSFLRNPHYHLPSDTIDTLDFSKMAEVVNSAYKAIVQLTA